MLRFLCYFILLYGKNNTHIVKIYECTLMNPVFSEKPGFPEL